MEDCGPIYERVELTCQEAVMHVMGHPLIRNILQKADTDVSEPSTHLPGGETSRISVGKIREVDQWEAKISTIVTKCVEEEHAARKSFGSQRGFFTFIYQELSEKAYRDVVRELWAKERLRTLVARWIDKYYRPGGAGFRKIMENTRVGKNT